MMILIGFCFLFLVLTLMLLWKKRMEFYQQQLPSCIITMTTFMGFEDRFQNVSKVLDPLVKTGQELVVINEWSQDASHYVEFMKKHYPQVTFLQKSKEDQGQARSLNLLIRNHLLHSSKKYWIHWEDTWVCTRSFYPEIVQMMETYPQVTQLQLTGDWKDFPRQQDLGCIRILLPLQHPQENNQTQTIYEMKTMDISEWPLFSLRPSINRLSFFQRHAKDFYFLEDPYLWPLRFEWEFGRIFLRNQGIKAITQKPYTQRLDGHKSTYTQLLIDGYGSTEEKFVVKG